MRRAARSGKPNGSDKLFAAYDEACKAWASRVSATVDNALTRFRIVRDDEGAA